MTSGNLKEAAEAGVHRTVHAGESGDAADVVEAITGLHAERIGHGYHVLHDPAAVALGWLSPLSYMDREAGAC